MKVEILIDDPAPKAAKRYKKGDTATVLHHQKRITSNNPFHFKVELHHVPTIEMNLGEFKNLSKIQYFFKDQVKIIS